MHASRQALCLGLLLVYFAIVGCERSEQSAAMPSAKGAATAKPTVYVVNYPLQYFAERIAGDAAEIVFPAPTGEDPAYWQPDADTINAYQKADLILLNGASYARWVDHATLPASKVIDTSRAFQDEFIELEGAIKHAHGPEGKHAHTDLAFTTWLDPTLAVQHATAIRDALTRRLPDRAEELSRNFEALESDLESLDAQLAALTADHGDVPLLASHPVYQYFARRYGLNLKSLHWEPGEAPVAEQWEELDNLLVEHPAKWMICEAPPDRKTEEELRDRGLRCMVFHPCANAPGLEDYLQTMQNNIRDLQTGPWSQWRP